MVDTTSGTFASYLGIFESMEGNDDVLDVLLTKCVGGLVVGHSACDVDVLR